jgi:hypothetical protein
LKVEGEKEEKDGWYDAGIEVNVSVPQLTEFNNGTRESFKGFFDEKGELITKENSIVIIMDAPKALKVEWDKEYYLKVESEYGLAKGGGWYKIGKEITISISEAIIDYGNSTRRKFSGWYENGRLLGKESALTIVIERPKAIVARWETEYEVKVITREGTMSNWYKKGEKVTISVPSREVYYEGIYVWCFRGWEIEGKIVSNSPQYSFEVEEPLTIKAVWEKELNSSLVTIIILAAVLLLSAIAALLKKMHLK